MPLPKCRLINSDVLEGLQTLPDESVQCCVTSPPYWGLRDYGTAKWDGGDSNCQHKVKHWDGPKQTQGAQSGHASKQDKLARQVCKCGAVRIDNQLGLEKTPEEYIGKMVVVFREVRRVLRKDGTLWLNVGDSYSGSGESGGENCKGKATRPKSGPTGLKPKDLCMIPARLALALQADGWWLRSDIIWHKPNPMPESCTDRPTTAHEHIFLLTKSARYFYDAEAVREEGPTYIRKAGGYQDKGSGLGEGTGGTDGRRGLGFKNKETVTNGRNLRSVWTLATEPFPEAHFATFPTSIPERCIKAGSKEGDLILDPFSGAATTLMVAAKLGRDAIGIELNPEYVAMSVKRLKKELGMLVEIYAL